MHFFVHSRANYFLRATIIIAAICIYVLGSLFLRASSVHAASSAQSNQKIQTYKSVTKGTLVPAGIADFKNPPSGPGGGDAPVRRPVDKGVRHFPGQVNAAARQLASTPDFSQQVGRLLGNFNGVSSLNSEVVNFNAEFEPPDQGLCVGNGFVVEPVNSALTIYRTTGSVVLGPLNVNDLFNEGPTEFTSDPRCYYDKSTNTWIAVVLYINSANTESRTDIAVNRSGNPTTPWTVYHLEATDDGTTGTPVHVNCPCLGDQPLLGLDGDNVYISTNEFALTGSGFNGAQIYALSKEQLFSLHTTNFVHFADLNIGGAVATSVQPAIAFGHADAGFFMNSLDPLGTSDNRIGVWAITHRGAVEKGGFPTLSSLVLTSETYSVPPAAIQKGNVATLDGGDDRLQQVQFINGNLWGALGTSVTVPHDTAARAGIAWFQVAPHVQNQLLSKAEIVNQGYVASAGNYLLYPAIQVGWNNSAVIVFTLSGANNFPSAAYAVMSPGSSSFNSIRIAAAGTGFYNKGTRWGDYSWAILDPDQNRFWLATEYVPPVSSQTTDGLTNWGTRVFVVDGRS